MAKVLISIDDELLRVLDARAKRLGMTRSAYVAQLARGDAQGSSVADPAVARSIARARAQFAAATDAAPVEDSTAFVRRMRDAR